jgi:hypothetical protein
LEIEFYLKFGIFELEFHQLGFLIRWKKIKIGDIDHEKNKFYFNSFTFSICRIQSIAGKRQD